MINYNQKIKEIEEAILNLALGATNIMCLYSKENKIVICSFLTSFNCTKANIKKSLYNDFKILSIKKTSNKDLYKFDLIVDICE